MDSKLAFYSLNKLRSFIKVHKDPLPDSSKRNVVYKISCNDYDVSYVGQTGRQLNTRISEHRKHICRNMTVYFVITDHRVYQDHDFDWDQVRVLDVERNLYKRLASKMLHIKLSLNYKQTLTFSIIPIL